MSNLDDNLESGVIAAKQIISLDAETAPFISERDLVQKFLLTLHRYHTTGDVDINHWLNGIKSDGSQINATAFQMVKVIDDLGNLITYVPPILLDPTGILPENITHSLGDIFYRAESLEKVYPGRGRAFIREQVTNNIRTKEHETDLWKKAWDALFVRYELDPVYDVTGELVTNSNSDGEPVDEEIEDVDYI